MSQKLKKKSLFSANLANFCTRFLNLDSLEIRILNFAGPFAHSVDQDATAPNVQFDLSSTLSNKKLFQLTLSKTINFRFFQTERVCDDNFKLDENGRKFSNG